MSKKVYLEAARRIAEGEATEANECLCSCCMVQEIDGCRLEDGAVRAYADLFRPDNAADSDFWGLEWGDEAHECRILALCFMAAISSPSR